MIQPLSGVIQDGTTPVTKTPTQQNITFAQGQDVTFQVTVTGSSGATKDLTGYTTFTLVIKPPPNSSPQTSLTLTGTSPAPATGVINFFMTAAQSKSLVTFIGYLFDVFTTNATGGKDEVVPQSFLQLNAAPGA